MILLEIMGRSTSSRHAKRNGLGGE
jgi:hypothetical protein